MSSDSMTRRRNRVDVNRLLAEYNENHAELIRLHAQAQGDSSGALQEMAREADKRAASHLADAGETLT